MLAWRQTVLEAEVQMKSRLLLLILFVLAVPSVAQAGAWYYKWHCTGSCAEGRLAISGVSAGYGSQEQCESDRWNDPRRENFQASGNLGGLTSCQEYESEPSADDVGARGAASPVPLQRFSLGLSAGSGWRVRDGSTDVQGPRTLGVDLNFVGGGRPLIGVEMGIGIQLTAVTAPHYGADAKPMLFVPFTLGLTSSPALVRTRKVEMRLDLGADIGALLRAGCSDCEADALSPFALIGVFRAGLDTYLGQNKGMGIGVTATFMIGKQGNMADEVAPSAVEIVPPTFLIRIAMLGRNTNLWW